MRYTNRRLFTHFTTIATDVTLSVVCVYVCLCVYVLVKLM